MMVQIKTAQEVKRSAPTVQAMVRAGSKLRRKLNGLTPHERAQLFMSIDVERDSLGISKARLAVEAGISFGWYGNVVRAKGANVSPRLIVALLRALKSLRAGEVRLRCEPLLVPAAFYACLSAACTIFGADIRNVRAQLRRAGEFTQDPEWMAATRARRIALYLGSTELGIRGADLAQAAGMTPAAVSIALNKIESARDDDDFDAACDRAAALVRGQ